MTLTEKHCVPCEGGIPPMDPESAQEYLTQVNDWKLLENATRIQRTFKFSNYVNTLDFVNLVAELSEAEWHHPDITFGWGSATVLYYSHKIKGLHENDFIMAAKVDEIYDNCEK